MFKIANELIGMVVGFCVIWMSVNFYIKMSDAEKNNEHFNPVTEGVKIIKETARDASIGWNDTTNVKN
jgi:hypothetical protein